jgi:hypothetical protein
MLLMTIRYRPGQALDRPSLLDLMVKPDRALGLKQPSAKAQSNSFWVYVYAYYSVLDLHYFVKI